MADERRAEGQRSSPKEVFERSMRSYWKTTAFNRYGGEIWLFTLIGTGRVHVVSVEIVNDIFAERIREQVRYCVAAIPEDSRRRSRTRARRARRREQVEVAQVDLERSRPRDDDQGLQAGHWQRIWQHLRL